MTTAKVLLPESIKIDSSKTISISNFFSILYTNREDLEDYLDVESAKQNPNAKFYNFDDIINEY